MWISTTRPMTIVFTVVSEEGRATVWTTSHSMAIGVAATRGGRTRTEGAATSPASAISSMPRGDVAEVAFICSRRSQVHRLNTNSGTSAMLARESLGPPSRWVPLAQYIIEGGSPPHMLKNENGARFTTPSAEIVEIQPIGRGVTRAL